MVTLVANESPPYDRGKSKLESLSLALSDTDKYPSLSYITMMDAASDSGSGSDHRRRSIDNTSMKTMNDNNNHNNNSLVSGANENGINQFVNSFNYPSYSLLIPPPWFNDRDDKNYMFDPSSLTNVAATSSSSIPKLDIKNDDNYDGEYDNTNEDMTSISGALSRSSSSSTNKLTSVKMESITSHSDNNNGAAALTYALPSSRQPSFVPPTGGLLSKAAVTSTISSYGASSSVIKREAGQCRGRAWNPDSCRLEVKSTDLVCVSCIKFIRPYSHLRMLRLASTSRKFAHMFNMAGHMVRPSLPFPSFYL
jgi:hypothetical protein